MKTWYFFQDPQLSHGKDGNMPGSGIEDLFFCHHPDIGMPLLIAFWLKQARLLRFRIRVFFIPGKRRKRY